MTIAYHSYFQPVMSIRLNRTSLVTLKKMDDLELLIVINHHYMKNKSPQDTKEKLKLLPLKCVQNFRSRTRNVLGVLLVPLFWKYLIKSMI